MFTNAWAKYLPVIRIVLKKSLLAEQMFALNISDFEKAGLKKRSGFKFLLKLKEGKPGNVIVDSPIVSDFLAVLRHDETIKSLLLQNEFHISLSPQFQLSIKHIKRHETVEQTASIPAL